MPWNSSTLQRLRRQRGLTQEQLAEAVGAHRITIVRLEAGALRPRVDLLEGLAGALGVEVTALLQPVTGHRKKAKGGGTRVRDRVVQVRQHRKKA
jgi:transcriptional regulator with XRE-family HTH domain